MIVMTAKEEKEEKEKECQNHNISHPKIDTKKKEKQMANSKEMNPS